MVLARGGRATGFVDGAGEVVELDEDVALSEVVTGRDGEGVECKAPSTSDGIAGAD